MSLARLALVAALLAAGCASDAPSGTVVVNMYDNAYSPPRVRIPEGGRVVFKNLGRNQHHAVALDESWSTEDDFGTLVMEQGDVAEVVFEKAGVYPFYCTFHGSPRGDMGMVGAVLVGDVEDLPEARRAPAVREASGGMRRVPQQYPRIQAAVDAADPGDLVLVDRGVYAEEVKVTTPSLVIRGVDRNEVVLDGDFRFGNGILALADGVAVENLTVRRYLLNGVYWSGVTGYRGSYLTVYNNGDYGLYAFDATDGLMEHSWASGHPDAGFYVGQCYPCRAVLKDLVSENNGLGYSGTNAGGELYIVESVFRRNMGGIVPNTLDSELMPPERETTIAGNLVLDNNNREAPAKPLEYPALGTGILIAGGLGNVIERNLVAGHERHGILILPSLDERFWPSRENRVRGNRVLRSGRADLAVGWPGTSDNCFSDNRFARSSPPGLERLQGCGGASLEPGFDVVPALAALLRQREAADGEFPHGDFREQPAASAQEGLPGGVEAPVRPAVEVFAETRPDLAAITLPPLPPGVPEETERRTPTLDAWAAYLPVGLALLWAVAALVDLARRREMSTTARGTWPLVLLLVPWLGALAYLAAARPKLGLGFRAGLVGGGLALYLLIVVSAAIRAAGSG